MFNRNDYVSDKDWQRFLDFSKDLETPNIVINLNTIKQNFIRLRDSFPYARIYYASLIGFTILPMLLSWRLKKECMNPVYVP